MIIYSLMFFDVTYWFYLAASLLYIGYLATKNDKLVSMATVITWIGLLANTLFLVARTLEAKHAPFSNLYESMMLFTWALVIGYLIVQRKYDFKAGGAFIMPLVFLAILATSLLPYHYQGARPLNPALQSGWLEIHVFVIFIGYAAFALSFGVSIMYLIKTRHREKGKEMLLLNVLPSESILDELAYKSIAWGFPFLTLGIITGAVWANYAWGSYWTWDPKETWSLITWFIYAAYLHARITKDWRGKRAAWISILGFISLLFLYWGVSFILPSLHTYAA